MNKKQTFNFSQAKQFFFSILKIVFIIFFFFKIGKISQFVKIRILLDFSIFYKKNNIFFRSLLKNNEINRTFSSIPQNPLILYLQLCFRFRIRAQIRFFVSPQPLFKPPNDLLAFF